VGLQVAKYRVGTLAGSYTYTPITYTSVTSRFSVKLVATAASGSASGCERINTHRRRVCTTERES
jgi:hypothetical protein